MLLYPPFAASIQINRAANNAPAMRKGTKGEGATILQAALLQLGYKLPISTRKTGKPDGVYGKEVTDVIRLFQKNQKLRQDGVAGKNTFGKLDQVMVAKSPPTPKAKPPVGPPPKPKIPEHRDYKIGTDDPMIKPDAGAGIWGSKSAELPYMALKETFTSSVFLGSAAIAIGDDAAKHLDHYLGNTGRDLTIDLEGMTTESENAKLMFELEVDQAKSFVETLPVGRHNITSRRAESSYNDKEQSKNWFYAVGGYSVWGKGVATVTEGASGRLYTLDFEYRFYDRYNWDTGKAVDIANIEITDEFMGEFHRQGLAKEYDQVGSLKRRFSWADGERIPPEQFKRGGESR